MDLALLDPLHELTEDRPPRLPGGAGLGQFVHDLKSLRESELPELIELLLYGKRLPVFGVGGTAGVYDP
jgi:hypothetical protein